ncbi:MAG: hypothetical protein EB015_17645, partial [Methylocystaceae bacterium]|nr:hypothetical protein [Methylocystaceae bacterium]
GDKNAGTNKTITVSGATAGANTNVSNYNINYVSDTNSTITQKALTVTALSQTKTYDGSTNVASNTAFNVSGLVSNETISAVTLAYGDKNAGTNKTITVSGATAGANTNVSNYNINYVNSTNSTINKANITGVSGISANDKSYDGTTTATINSSAANFSGKISGDNLILTGGTGGFATKNAANNIVVNLTNLTLSGTDAGNYNLVGTAANFSGTANITPRSVSVSAISVNNKSYDGTNSAVVNYSSAVITGIVSGDQVNITSATAVYADASIGINKSVSISNVTLGGADSSNYKLVSSNFSAVSSIINNTSTATTNATIGLTFSDDVLQQYTATVLSKINKIEFTQPAYTYLHTVKQNSDYLQVDYIERGVNITISGR